MGVTNRYSKQEKPHCLLIASPDPPFFPLKSGREVGWSRATIEAASGIWDLRSADLRSFFREAQSAQLIALLAENF
jgi:hypothetical protein